MDSKDNKSDKEESIANRKSPPMMKPQLPLPPLISLKISSSILLTEDNNNEAVAEIVLPQNALLDDNGKHEDIGFDAKGAQTINMNGDIVCQKLTIRPEQALGEGEEDHLFTNRIYMTSTSSTKKRKRLIVQPSSSLSKNDDETNTKQLKDIGTKVRNRLHEEKSKRREIRMLDIDSLPEQTNKKKTNLKKKPPPTSTTNRSRKTSATTTTLSKRATKKPKRSSANQPQHRSGSATTSTTLSPDISHIPIPTSKEESSTFVRIHGLPKNCTGPQLRKFFSGLPIKGIFVLLSNDTHISQLDAYDNNANESYDERNNDEDEDNNKRSSQKVHKTTFRILVKFQSAPIAKLASERSGETIKSNVSSSSSSSSSFSHQYSSCHSIGVTQLTKSMAAILSKLVIPIPIIAPSSASAPPSDSPVPSFQQILSNIEETLHPNVIKILWTSAATSSGPTRITFPLSNATMEYNILFEHRIRHCDDDPTTFEGYQQYARRHNQLVKLQDELINHNPCLFDMNSKAIKMMMKSTTSTGTTSGSFLPVYPSISTQTKKDDDDDNHRDETIEETDGLQRMILARLTIDAYKVLSSEMDQIDQLLYHVRKLKGF